MIKLQNYTPDIYYKESRDFQFIGRLFDLVLNYSKTNADLLYNLPFSSNSDDQFIELMSLTLGFRAKHRYTAKHLRAICSVFTEILKNKGTINAVLLACNAIFHAEGIEQEMEYELTDNNTNLILYLPQQLGDTTLLTDLFEYILPAGLSCQIIKLVLINKTATTEIEFTDVFKIFDNGDVTPRSPANKHYLYKNNSLAKLPQYFKSEQYVGFMSLSDSDTSTGISQTTYSGKIKRGTQTDTFEITDISSTKTDADLWSEKYKAVITNVSDGDEILLYKHNKLFSMVADSSIIKRVNGNVEYVNTNYADSALQKTDDKWLVVSTSEQPATAVLYITVYKDISDRSAIILGTSDAINANADDRQGILANTSIYRPGEDN